MVPRVYFRSGIDAALSVSRPGVDVTQANMDQMMFDSRWSGHQFFMSGQIASVNNQISYVNFPVVLDSPPLFVGYCDYAYTTTPGQYYSQMQAFHYTSGGTRWWYYYAIVTSSYIGFQSYDNQTPSPALLYFALFRKVAG